MNAADIQHINNSIVKVKSMWGAVVKNPSFLIIKKERSVDSIKATIGTNGNLTKSNKPKKIKRIMIIPIK